MGEARRRRTRPTALAPARSMTLDEVGDALKSLERKGLVVRLTNGRWRAVKPMLEATPAEPKGGNRMTDPIVVSIAAESATSYRRYTRTEQTGVTAHPAGGDAAAVRGTPSPVPGGVRRTGERPPASLRLLRRAAREVRPASRQAPPLPVVRSGLQRGATSVWGA
jgi:hypothetical protein